MDSPPRRSANVDRIARALAQSAGQPWDGLANYPGYTKNQWRERAALLLKAIEMPSLLDR